MFNSISLDWFNSVQIVGIVSAIALARALEVSNRKLHEDNLRQDREDPFEDMCTELGTTQQNIGAI